MASAPPPLILASRSPRRAELLAAAGYAVAVAAPPFDDPAQPEHPADGDVPALAAALAAAKADSLAAALRDTPQQYSDLPLDRPLVLLAADTLCIDAQGRPAGKPATSAALLTMLTDFVDATHRVTTGVALRLLDSDRHVSTSPDHDVTFADTAAVTWGRVSNEQLERYADTDTWHGKAGGYNLDERVAAGWPITVDGDPATVTGLPMRRLCKELEHLGVVPDNANAARATEKDQRVTNDH